MDLLVNIDVDDLPKAITFYEQAAGLRLGRRFGALGVEMLGASSPVYLLVKPAGTRPSPRADGERHYRRHWTLGPHRPPGRSVRPRHLLHRVSRARLRRDCERIVRSPD
jgi:catechol 2,3-dioxygenase-like lactoylglutathione lyase family enzyme